MLGRRMTLWSGLATAATVVLFLAAACARSTPDVQRGTAAAPTPANGWQALLQNTPFPYSIPLPPPTPTILDGTYAKEELREPSVAPCKRCPDYNPEAGVWKLNLDRGVFRIWHQGTGWRSIGSFTTFYDQTARQRVDPLVLFNDPYCPGVVGLYNWRREDGQLILEVVGDTCSMGLRAVNISSLPWLSCQPPTTEAGTTDHWPKLPGCE